MRFLFSMSSWLSFGYQTPHKGIVNNYTNKLLNFNSINCNRQMNFFVLLKNYSDVPHFDKIHTVHTVAPVTVISLSTNV